MSLESTYLSKVSHRLRNFRWNVSGSLANFSCPICGDSKHDKTKARGYILENHDKTVFYCHNCAHSSLFGNFLEYVNPSVAKEYKLESFRQRSQNSRTPKSFGELAKASKTEGGFENTPTPTPAPKDAIVKLPPDVVEFEQALVPILDLPNNHLARVYLRGRFVDEEKFGEDLFFLPETQMIKRIPKYDQSFSSYDTTPRVVIALTDQQGIRCGYVARSLDPTAKKRYVSLSVTDGPIIYGLNHIDPNRRVYALEGVFDAFLLPNSLASLSSNFKDIQALGLKDLVIIRDNEPRATQIHKLWEHDLKNGFRLFCWPKYIRGKDLQEVVANKEIPRDKIQALIDSHIISGTRGLIQFKSWKV